MTYIMQPYDDALERILKEGVVKSNKRTGVKTLAVCGIQSRYKIDESFPIVTRRKVWPKSIFAELLWFISGSTNNKDLQALGANIWTPWVDRDFEEKHGFAKGSFGPVYGFQLRHFGGHYGNGIGGKKHTENTQESYDDYVKIGGKHGLSTFEKTRGNGEHAMGNLYGVGGFDQLNYMISRIGQDPSCRRIMFSLWNPRDLNEMRLPPCHYTYQVFIDDEKRMSGMLTQRSCDFPIGVPANIQFYSALTMMIAQQTGYEPYEFVHSTVDSHIYWDQIDAVKQYLETPIIDSPKLTINKARCITEYKMEDFVLEGFQSGPKIEIPVAV